MSATEMKRILVTGACGQIGSELAPTLRARYGEENVVASDIAQPCPALRGTGPFVFMDVTKRQEIAETVDEYNIDTVFHMAAILSASGEKKPLLAWDVNINGLHNVLEVARERGLRVFSPSSIAAFGPDTPKDLTPQATVLRPTTMYGVTKVTGELLADYYFSRFGIDVRGIRYPGVISSETLPGGGTTDYAVAIFYEAIKHKRYTCFVKPDTVLPMIYMPDCVRATIMLMQANPARLQNHSDFNLSALSFSAQELADEIKHHIPEFECDYEPDFRQEIADSWPRTIDDTAARQQWDWKPEYDLATMVADMLEKLTEKQAQGLL